MPTLRAVILPVRTRKANEKIENLILTGERDKLIKYENSGSKAALANPNAEHYPPLLYALALKNKGEMLKFSTTRLVRVRFDDFGENRLSEI